MSLSFADTLQLRDRISMNYQSYNFQSLKMTIEDFQGMVWTCGNSFQRIIRKSLPGTLRTLYRL